MVGPPAHRLKRRLAECSRVHKTTHFSFWTHCLRRKIEWHGILRCVSIPPAPLKMKDMQSVSTCIMPITSKDYILCIHCNTSREQPTFLIFFGVWSSHSRNPNIMGPQIPVDGRMTIRQLLCHGTDYHWTIRHPCLADSSPYVLLCWRSTEDWQWPNRRGWWDSLQCQPCSTKSSLSSLSLPWSNLGIESWNWNPAGFWIPDNGQISIPNQQKSLQTCPNKGINIIEHPCLLAYLGSYGSVFKNEGISPRRAISLGIWGFV